MRLVLALLVLVGAKPVTAQIPKVLTYRFCGWLHTSGTNLCDELNHPVRLLSVNHSGAEWGAGVRMGADGKGGGPFGSYAMPSSPLEYNRLNAWGFNSVRLLLSWANLEPTPPTLTNGSIVHYWNEAYLTNVDGMIGAFAAHGLGVVISLHQWTFSPVFTNATSGIHGLGMPVWLYYDTNTATFKSIGHYQLDAGLHSKTTAEHYFFGDAGTNTPAGVYPEIFSNYPSPTRPQQGYTVQDGFIDAWKLLAARYATNRAVVGADLYNEPPYDTAINLTKFYNVVGSNIAAVNPHLLLICQDSLLTDPKRLTCLMADQQARPALSNLVYSAHVYANRWDDLLTNGSVAAYKEHSLLTNYQATSSRWEVPFWVGEFDQFVTNGTVNVWDMQKTLQYCQANAISWAYFAYDRAAQPLVDTNGMVATNLVELLQSGFDTPLNHLTIAPAGEQLALTWPASPTNLVLQWTTNLTAGPWLPVDQSPAEANFQNTVLIDATKDMRLYRLWQP